MTASDATISVRLPQKTRDALDAAAKATQRSRAFLIKEALDKHLPPLSAQDRSSEVKRKLKLIRELKGAGNRHGGLRSAEDIDRMIRTIRGDD